MLTLQRLGVRTFPSLALIVLTRVLHVASTGWNADEIQALQCLRTISR